MGSPRAAVFLSPAPRLTWVLRGTAGRRGGGWDEKKEVEKRKEGSFGAKAGRSVEPVGVRPGPLSPPWQSSSLCVCVCACVGGRGLQSPPHPS